MQILGCVVAGLVGLCVVIEAKTIGSTAAGLALVYSLSFTSALKEITRAHGDCQTCMNSVERIQEYCKLASEHYFPNTADGGNSAAADNSYVKPAKSGVHDGWPSEGKVEFKNVSLTYDDDDSSFQTETKTRPKTVLSNVCFSVPGGQKIGICGRSGAGKSSLVTCLFRTYEPKAEGPDGGLFIDDINVLDVPLHTLRSALSIVPQDPILMKGSVRFNLDPSFSESQDKLKEAIKDAQMLEFVEKMEGRKLEDKLIEKGGEPLSQGQRQLLCMARALLRKKKILVLDESTASVDQATEDKVKNMLKNLSGCTVLTIAHRLETIVDHDLILVMDGGKVSESGEPWKLLTNSQGNGSFYQMARESGNYDALLAIAKRAAAERAEQEQ